MNQATLHAIPTFQPSDEDRALELSMSLLMLEFSAARRSDKPAWIKWWRRRQIWGRYVKLHNSRSPEMVAHLERQRGLAR